VDEMKRWYDELKKGDHAAHIYHTEGERVKVIIDLLAWMGEAEKLVIMTNGEDGERLAPRSRILDAAMEDGHLDIIPARSSLSSSGKFRAETLMDIIYLELGKALDEGRSGLVFVWELDWLSQEPENFEAHIVQQSKLSLTALPRELTLMGQYGVANFSAQQVERLLRVNQLVLEDGQLNRNFWVVSTTSLGGPPRDLRHPSRSPAERSPAKGS
jgi:MEDS: MEthanogen/methylotroph, DcmR Sensory domain